VVRYGAVWYGVIWCVAEWYGSHPQQQILIRCSLSALGSRHKKS
jgi:hypothetical protein